MADLSQVAAEVVDRMVGGVEASLVWVNPLMGRTYRLDTEAGTQFLKLSPKDAPASHDVLLEAERLRWVEDRVPVPVVLETGSNDVASWMRTEGLTGVAASDQRWRSDPRATATSLGRAVRAFHDNLTSSVTDCPWSWRVADRLTARPESAQARAMSADAPEEADLVVGHGDLCTPNVLLTDEGSLAGFVDLGKLGVADRAADLGCGVWSLEFNQLGFVVDEFLAAYGLPVDRVAVEWYRDFYEAA